MVCIFRDSFIVCVIVGILYLLLELLHVSQDGGPALIALSTSWSLSPSPSSSSSPSPAPPPPSSSSSSWSGRRPALSIPASGLRGEVTPLRGKINPHLHLLSKNYLRLAFCVITPLYQKTKVGLPYRFQHVVLLLLIFLSLNCMYFLYTVCIRTVNTFCLYSYPEIRFRKRLLRSGIISI